MTAQVPMLTDEEINRASKLYGQSASPNAISRHHFSQGMQSARSIYEARLAEDAKVRAQLVEALDGVDQLCRDVEEHKVTNTTKSLWPEIAEQARAALAAAKEIK